MSLTQKKKLSAQAIFTGIRNMKRFFLSAMIFIFSAFALTSIFAESLSGKLEKRWSYGAPNYGETLEMDSKNFYDVLVLDSPQCTKWRNAKC